MTTTLYKAAASGDVAALEEMMHKQKKNVDILAQVSQRGDTVLHISAFHGRRDFVEKLLQLMKKPDEEATNEEQRHSFLRAQSEEENSALHEALKGGDNAQIVKMLITVDAELAGISNNKGESPLFTASAYALKMLLPNTDPRHYARFDGQTYAYLVSTILSHPPLSVFFRAEVAAELIEKAPELCKIADYFLGNTPLHVAALRGCRKSTVEKLLQCDTSSSFKQDKLKQQTALHLAAQRGHADVVNCILRFAEDCVEIRDESGKTALHCAVENAPAGVVKSLVRFARVINIADKNGYTALDIANQKYNEEPLSPYFAIRRILRRKNAIEGVEAVDQRKKTSKPFPSEEKYSTTINCLSVCAILIATVTFQAAFTLPPHEKYNRSLSTRLSRRAFEAFVIWDWLAFCTSIVAAVLLAYATFLRRHRGFVVGLRHDYYKLAAFFYCSMYYFAPTTIIVIFVMLYKALGLGILESIRGGFFIITVSAEFTLCRRIIGFFRPLEELFKVITSETHREVFVVGLYTK
ncbi:ankyrin repeat-containing protein ITN1-like [Cryptomeria japonica]|uniref:ankyrin repeat-containing protein ITN1-like n=1 Tax=Cryptomeria japonica TaxID=3369 RepID=UPI0027DA0B8E|nr:ankyrin repeat-containing protein ITN1-like [Cryptomeria japonica]